MKNLTAKNLSVDEKSFLVSTMAEIDSVFSPWRIPRDGKKSWAAREQLLSEYRSHGLRSVGRGDAADRKSAERLTRDLSDAGWMTVRTVRKARFVRLTDAADDCLRTLCGLTIAADAWRYVDTIRRLTADGRTNAGCAYEVDILADDAADKIFGLELDVLALLVRGILGSHSDSLGRVGYAIEQPNATQPRRPIDQAWQRKWANCYDSRYREFFHHRRGLASPANNIVIPLGTGSWT